LSVNLKKAKEFDMLSYTTKSALNMICGEYNLSSLAWLCQSSQSPTFLAGTSFGLDIKNTVMSDDVFHALEK
jgi:hypothetical protein